MKIIKWKKIYMIDYYMYNKYFVNYFYIFKFIDLKYVCEVLNISVCLFMYIIDICLLIILCG